MTIKQVVVTDTDGAASRPDVSDAEHEAEERDRGYGDGVVWARDYAPADQLRDFVENFGSSVDSASEIDRFLRAHGTEHKRLEGLPEFEGPYWEGFREGAEDVLAHGDSPLTT